MSNCGLGRPSTIVNHVGKFIERGLVDADFALTEKGQAWTQRIGELFSGNRGLSKTVETYLELNRKPAEDMVREMITLCALDSAVGSGANQGYDDDEELEISSGHVS
jgi:DNA topoisomerase-1